MSWGPFLALQPGTDEIIESVGLGLMWGFKRSKNDSNSSWNIGIGAVVDPNTKILGVDVLPNMPLPVGEQVIRTQETSQWGALVLVSFTF